MCIDKTEFNQSHPYNYLRPYRRKVYGWIFKNVYVLFKPNGVCLHMAVLFSANHIDSLKQSFSQGYDIVFPVDSPVSQRRPM